MTIQTSDPVMLPKAFDRALSATAAEAIERPSLSYWQDAWVRLKQNPRALASLYLVIALVAFTLLGPTLWTVDPSSQDIEQISRPPTLGSPAVIVDAHQVWDGVELDDFPAYPDEDAEEESGELAAPTALQAVGAATTQFVRIRWAPVAGSSGYLIYRNDHRPEAAYDLGLPLGTIDGGNIVGYEDRLNLDPQTYYYSVVATDGIDESEHYTTLELPVRLAITAADAAQRNLRGDVGDTIRLAAHPLGTDYLGRDMLSRLMHGARVSLFIGLVAPLCFISFGMLYGGMAGYFGGRVDSVLMRFADFVVALPFLLFMILFKIAFGIGPGESGIVPMLIALVLLGWPSTARLVRGQILQIREEAYVHAAQLLGANTHYLILRHMLPNAFGVILVSLTFAIPSAIFTEAFLSFIGMGVAPPTPSWGSMCNDGIKTMLSHPHELIFPALLISVTVLAFNLLGDGLRDALDARMRGTD